MMDSPQVYQLRIWLKEISPMIWRRLLVKSDTSIADLHHCIQIAMGWEDEHLHQFIIRGKSYGVYHDGGISFSDNPKQVYLSSFQFRIKEKFTYEYNFSEQWVHEIRIEKQMPINQRKMYPLCIGGSRAAPPEDCGGPLAFMELEDHYSPWNIEKKLIKLIRAKIQLDEGKNEDDGEELDEDEEEYAEETLEKLIYWANRHRFNRHKVNRQFQNYFNEEEEKKQEEEDKNE